MTHEQPPVDPLHAALDPLVVDGTLHPQQADRVYRAVTAQAGPRPVDATSAAQHAGHRDTRSALPLGLAIVAASLAVTALFVAATLAANRDFEWMTFIVLIGVTAAFAAGAAASDRLLTADGNRRWLVSLLATLAVIGLGLTLLP